MAKARDPRYERALEATWRRPPGLLAFLFDTSHKSIGTRFIVTALAFMLLGGLDATLIRTQLAVPNASVIGPQTFNQLFTTHGSAMMYLFAVPIVEGLATYFVPLMVGARDMPFPRLNAFGYFLYLFGGLMVYAPTLADLGNLVLPGSPLPRWIPDNGWFSYVPLASGQYSPDPGQDIWLVALTLVEFSALFAAIELTVTILKCRAPGMTLSRMPLFVWSVLGMAIAIILAFPSLIVASTLLELQRALDLPFFDPLRGGEPVLWQHLFWIFGHPEVYVMFLPATGIISTMLPAFTRRPIVGYALIVLAVLATAALSLGLWVHHMFAVGLPWLGLTIFSASSMMIAIPSGIQVFAWLATMLRGRSLRLTTPMLFVIGFIVTFVAGGLTGVMVASVPFDLQVHDTYFVVAHFHYVLVGGVLFPVFAGLYYWFPKVTGRVLDERLGRLAFVLQFVGLNLAFLPQHGLGLLGMPRRVFTYPDEPGLAWMNLVSTIGAYVMALGVLAVGLDFALAAVRKARAARDPWGSHTLEWATESPPHAYSFASPPIVRTRDPLWDAEGLSWGPEPSADAIEAPGGLWRELLGTDPITARPTDAVWVPARSPWPFLAAGAFTAAALALLAKLYPVSFAMALGGVALIVIWLWPTHSDREAVPAGRTLPGFDVPTHADGAASTGWWGLVMGLSAAAFGYLGLAFATIYLSVLRPGWPPPGTETPTVWLPLVSVLAAAIGAGTSWLARDAARSGRSRLVVTGWLAVTGLFGTAAVLLLGLTVLEGPSPTSHGVAAGWVTLAVVQGVAGAGAVAASGIAALQGLLGHFDRRRNQALDHVRIGWLFVAGTWVATTVVLLLLQGRT